MLESLYDIYDLDCPPNEWLCTLALSRKSLRLPVYNLPWVAEHLDLPAFDHHDASSDAAAASNVLLKIAERLAVSDLGALMEQSQRPMSAADISDGDIGLAGIEGVPGALAGEVVCITGKLMLKRQDAEDLALSQGAVISKSVTRKTTILVTGEFSEGTLRPGADMSRKLEKAIESVNNGQKLEILTENDFLRRIADEKEEIKRRLALRATGSWLPAWALEAVRSMDVGKDWFRFLREVIHPEGRAIGGESCIRCGDQIPPHACYQHRNRHVCGASCNSALKSAWRRIGNRENLFGSESSEQIAAYQDFFRKR